MQLAHDRLWRACAGALLGAVLGKRVFAPDHPYQDQDDGDHEQDVDEPSDSVGGDQPEQPQDYQYCGHCVKHGGYPIGE